MNKLDQSQEFHNISGINTEIIVWGNGTPSYCFFHGFGGNARSFKPIIKGLLNQNKTCISISLPWHGNSEDTNRAFDITNYIQELHHILKDYYLCKNLHLMAHSLGSRFSLTYQTEYQNEVLSNHLITPAGFYPWEIRTFKLYQNKWVRLISKLTFIQKAITTFLVGKSDSRLRNAFFWYSLNYNGIDLLRNKVHIQLFKLNNIHLYAGGKDAKFPVTFIEDVANHFIKPKIFVFHEAGHLVMRDFPDEITDALLGYDLPKSTKYEVKLRS